MFNERLVVPMEKSVSRDPREWNTITEQVRARGLGVPFAGTPGRNNAITDVSSVEVGMATIIDKSTNACTGATLILPRGKERIGHPYAAATFSLNGNGEMTGRSWIEESGQSSLPIGITNSHSVGAVHAGIEQWVAEHEPSVAKTWMLPVVAETWDGYLNDINAQHVSVGHVSQAINAASGGPVAEGSHGGGTGMNCYGFKGGTGTASREVQIEQSSYTVGVLVQANFGSRKELTICGVPIGRKAPTPCPMETMAWLDQEIHGAEAVRAQPGAGSVIVVVATDAPLLPVQLKGMARRVSLGLARTGTTGGHFSGDIFLAFSTANSGAMSSTMPQLKRAPVYESLEFVAWGQVDAFYEATVQAVEEAVINALVVNENVEGRDGHISYALPHNLLTRKTFDHVR